MIDKSGPRLLLLWISLRQSVSAGVLLIKPRGGAIASTGCTGYGMGYEGNPVSLSGELESNFFYQIGNGSTNLAQAHSQAIQKFLAEDSNRSNRGVLYHQLGALW